LQGKTLITKNQSHCIFKKAPAYNRIFKRSSKIRFAALSVALIRTGSTGLDDKLSRYSFLCGHHDDHAIYQQNQLLLVTTEAACFWKKKGQKGFKRKEKDPKYLDKACSTSAVIYKSQTRLTINISNIQHEHKRPLLNIGPRLDVA
jgi:hypothetical protein